MPVQHLEIFAPAESGDEADGPRESIGQQGDQDAHERREVVRYGVEPQVLSDAAGLAVDAYGADAGGYYTGRPYRFPPPRINATASTLPPFPGGARVMVKDLTYRLDNNQSAKSPFYVDSATGTVFG